MQPGRTFPLGAAAFAVLISATIASAQSVQLGVTGGMAINSLTGSDADGTESRSTPTYGVQLVWQSASVIGFEIGAQLVSKGASGNLEEDITADFKFGYVEVPVLLRLALVGAGSTIRPVLSLGGSLGINSSCNVEGTEGSVSVEVACDEPAFSGAINLKSLDIGISGGAAVDIAASDRLVIAPAVRYTRGMTTIFDIAESSDAKNSSLGFSLALRMRF